MSIAGKVILTINGQRVHEVTDGWFEFHGAHGGGETTSMREAIATLREDALRRWGGFNQVYATPLRMGKPHYGGGNSHQRRKRRRAQTRQVQALLRDFGMGKPIILPCGE